MYEAVTTTHSQDELIVVHLARLSSKYDNYRTPDSADADKSLFKMWNCKGFGLQ